MSKEHPGVRPASPATPRQYLCEEHGIECKARNGQHGEFWSHQVKGTRQWCNESKR
jgi:hypothetical protein